MAQIFLQFMHMNQESIWQVSMPYYFITVPQMHIPPKSHFQKAMGGVKKFFCDYSSSKLNFVLNNSHYMQNSSSNSFVILGSNIFISDNGVLVLF